MRTAGRQAVLYRATAGQYDSRTVQQQFLAAAGPCDSRTVRQLDSATSTGAMASSSSSPSSRSSRFFTTQGSPSGRPPKPRQLQKLASFDIDSEADQLRLLKACAKSEPMTAMSATRPQRYQPIFKHPLPVSDHSADHDANLRRARCCALPRQVAAAVTFGDAWVLEELFMQGAPIDTKDKNGFTPLHLAVQMNSFESVMVLLICGVDVNATTLSGVTPLYLAVSAGASEAASVLRENGGLMEVDFSGQGHPIQALDVTLPTYNSSLDGFDALLGMPKRHTLY